MSRKNDTVSAKQEKHFTEEELQQYQDDIPFRKTLSFHVLLDYWRKEIESGDAAFQAYGRRLLKDLEKAPELLKPIEDMSLLEKHSDLIKRMMTILVPPAVWDRNMLAVVPPFGFKMFYATPNFEKYLRIDGLNSNFTVEMDHEELIFAKTITAFTVVLKKFYDIDLLFDFPIILKTVDEDTGLDRYFKSTVDARFSDIIHTGELRPISPEDVKHLVANMNDLEVWNSLLPPDQFEFRGFTVFHAVDVTDQEALSGLKFGLIGKNSVTSDEGFASLERQLQSFMRKPDIKLGLTPFAPEMRNAMDYARKVGRSVILEDSCEATCSSFTKSIYARAYDEAAPKIIDDLAAWPDRSEIEEHLFGQGYRCIVVAPLQYDDQIVGMLEIISKQPGYLTAANVIKVKEVLPLFAMALKRTTEEFNNQVQAVIKEECTAIHPAVEWRFRDAAFNLIAYEDDENPIAMEDIVFESVYPLYGLSDIRNSSTQRNESIQSDLLEHLNLAHDVVVEARAFRPMPVLDEIAFRIDKHMQKIRKGLSSGDELSTLEYVHNNVEPLFRHLREFNPLLKLKIDAYFARLDQNLGILYNKRRDFDESVAQINDCVSSVLEDEQEKAQEIFPHYFEKYKTDGVDHGMYIGQSLVEDHKFDRIYLQNLRLWQLMIMCQVVRKTHDLKSSLKIPLETAHLVLVQDTPLSIRFRHDEKKFDVDGAYNIRYEIMKKRIDKAMIKGRKERLTQPGKIAIVYSQAKEAAEYHEYLEFLLDSGYLSGAVDDVELEDLQGIKGLRALRVSVVTDSPANNGKASPAVKRNLQTMAFTGNGGVKVIPEPA